MLKELAHEKGLVTLDIACDDLEQIIPFAAHRVALQNARFIRDEGLERLNALSRMTAHPNAANHMNGAVKTNALAGAASDRTLAAAHAPPQQTT